jgi:hypothetical protein
VVVPGRQEEASTDVGVITLAIIGAAVLAVMLIYQYGRSAFEEALVEVGARREGDPSTAVRAPAKRTEAPSPDSPRTGG